MCNVMWCAVWVVYVFGRCMHVSIWAHRPCVVMSSSIALCLVAVGQDLSPNKQAGHFVFGRH